MALPIKIKDIDGEAVSDAFVFTTGGGGNDDPQPLLPAVQFARQAPSSGARDGDAPMDDLGTGDLPPLSAETLTLNYAQIEWTY